jgi:hypothetical protein
MLGWLAAFCLFWVVASLYLGGLDVELEGGGGFRQFLGLLVMNLLFLGVWRALVLLPVLARAGFGVFGVKVRRGGAAHAH